MTARSAVIGVLALCCVATASWGAVKESPRPAFDEAALERSLEMLELQMKMRVLQVYAQRAGVYIPPAWPQRYQKRYEQVVAEMNSAARLKSIGFDHWIAEEAKKQKSETEKMYELAKTTVAKFIEQQRGKLADAEALLDQAEDLQRRRKDRLEVARFVEGIAERIQAVNKDPNDARLAEQQIQQWRTKAAELYKGAVSDTDRLIESIAAHEKRRADINIRLAYLAEVEKGLEHAGTIEQLFKDMQDPSAAVQRRIKEKYDAKVDQIKEDIETGAVDRAQRYLEERYTGVPEKYAEETWGKIKADFATFKGLYESVGELDKDATLAKNPVALGAAKRFTVLAGLYKWTLGKVKDNPAAKPFAPIFEVLDMYAQVLEAVPGIARTMQNYVTQVDQDYRNVRAMDAWAFPDADPGTTNRLEGKLLREVTVLSGFATKDGVPLQVATDADLDAGAPNAVFYMLVPKQVVPRGYASFSREQFERLAEAIAYERFVRAPKKAALSQGWLPEWIATRTIGSMLYDPGADAASRAASEDFIAALKEESHKLPWDHAELIQLAHGEIDVATDYNEQAKSVDQYREDAETHLTRLAEAMLVRTALNNADEAPHESVKKWYAFRRLLRTYKAAFAPNQLLNLFHHFAQGDTQALQVKRYLWNTVRDREKAMMGTAQVGIPNVERAKVTPAGNDKKRMTLTADVLVAELSPDRIIDAVLELELPAYAEPADPADAKPKRIQLNNGVVRVERDVIVPNRIADEEVRAKVVVKVPVERVEPDVPNPDGDTPAPDTPQPDTPGPNNDGEQTADLFAKNTPVRRFVGSTFDAPVQVSGGTPKLSIRWSESQRSGREPFGVIVEPPEAPEGVVAWELRRARSPSGPWSVIEENQSLSGKPFVDRLPMAFTGSQKWYYLALPKTRQQGTHRARPTEEDLRKWSSITIDMSLESPKLSVVLWTESQQRLNHDDPKVRASEQELLRKDEEQHKRAIERRQKDLAEARSDNSRWVNRKFLEREELRRRAELWSQEREPVIRFSGPVLGGALSGSKQAVIQFYRAPSPEGPWTLDKLLGAQGEGRYVVDDTSIPGRTWWYRARYIHRQSGWTVKSDWSNTIEVKIPPKRIAVAGRSLGGVLGEHLNVGPNQRVLIRVEEARYEPHLRVFEPYFQQHGADGMSEETYARFSREARDKYIKDYWDGISERNKREKRAHYEQLLAKRLENEERKWLPYVRRQAVPVPGAPLGAVIGRFTPDVEYRRGEPAPPKPKPQYFLVGREAEFTTPDYGEIELMTNWPVEGRLSMEPEEVVYLAATMEALTFSNPDYASIKLSPKWMVETEGSNAGNEWDLDVAVNGWEGRFKERFQFYAARTPEGPWTDCGDLDEPEDAPKRFYSALIGQEAYIRGRVKHYSDYPERGSTWTDPIRVRCDFNTLTVGMNKQPMLVGRRGQTVTVTFSGAWDPFRYQGLEPYGPEGVDEERFQRIADEVVAREKAGGPGTEESNQPHLLGRLFGGTRKDAKGGLMNSEAFLKNKASMRFADFPAGAVVAVFTPVVPSDVDNDEFRAFDGPTGRATTRHGFPMATARRWSFTFPADGFIRFQPNYSFGWTGSHFFEGGGELTLKVAYSGGGDADGPTDGTLASNWTPPQIHGPGVDPLSINTDHTVDPLRNERPNDRPDLTDGPVRNVTPVMPDDGVVVVNPDNRPVVPPPDAPDNRVTPNDPTPPDNRVTPTPQHTERRRQSNALLQRAADAARRNDHDEEERLIRQALSTNDTNPGAHGALGVVMARQQRWPQAVAAYRRSIELNPDDPTTHSYLADALYWSGKPGEGEAAARKAAELQPDSHYYRYLVGVMQHAQKRFAEAEANIARALDADPDNVDYLNHYGTTLYEQRKLDQALAAYDRAMRLDPNNGYRHAQVAGVQFLKQQLNEAYASANAHASWTTTNTGSTTPSLNRSTRRPPKRSTPGVIRRRTTRTTTP